jgi:hypothetical protein
VILTAVVLPHPPLLLRELTGAEDVAAGLRNECVDALRSVLSTRPDAVVVVGGAEVTGEWDPRTPVDVASFGTTAARVAGLPLSLGVGARLLAEAGWAGETRLRAVGWEASADELAELADDIAAAPGRLLLVVLGDGSARRSEKAPGHLDERAFAFDDTLARALAEGDAAALEDLDAALASELMVAGRAALAVLGRVCADRPRPEARLVHREDSFGVTYLVARWHLGGAVAG